MRPSHAAIGAAGSTFVLGFGVLACWSVAAPGPDGVPGMWQYWSGTVGDAILLPSILGGLTAGAVKLSREGYVVGWALPAISGFLGVILGALSQLSWILDPEPRLNWMVIKPNSLSAAGWYHVVFLIAASAAISWLLGHVLAAGHKAAIECKSIDDAKGRTVLTVAFGSNATGVVIAAAALFTVALIADSVPSLRTVASQGTILSIAVGLVAAIGLAVLAFGRESAVLLRPAVL